MPVPMPQLQAILGKIMPPSYYQQLYGVDEVRYVNEISAWVAAYDPDIIFTMAGLNTDSGSKIEEASFDGILKHHVQQITSCCFTNV